MAEKIVSPPFEFRMAYKPEGYSSNMDAQFSIPYCLAVYLLDPEPGPNWFTEERLRDPKVLEIASKVKATGDTIGLHECFKLMRVGSFPEVTVRVVLKDGKEFSHVLRFPKGHPKNRLSYDEFKDRFRRSASFALKPQKIEKAIDAILTLEDVDNMSTLAELMYD